MKHFSFICLLSLAVFAVPGKAQDATDTAATAQQSKLGKRAYIRCQACHSLGADEEHRTGPNLHGLFGAKVGQKEGFAYSDALSNSDIVWEDESLRAWLRSPSTYIPGNKMAFGGVPSEKELDALMIYLQDQTK